MNINENDKQMFLAFNQSETGKQLVNYLERVKISIGYLPQNTEVAKAVVEAIDNLIIKKITLQNEEKDVELNPFE